MTAPPHPMLPGASERDYYRLGAAGPAAPRHPASEADTPEGYAGDPQEMPDWTPQAGAEDNGAGDERAGEPE